jgi:hypothetical protein
MSRNLPKNPLTLGPRRCIIIITVYYGVLWRFLRKNVKKPLKTVKKFFFAAICKQQSVKESEVSK